MTTSIEEKIAHLELVQGVISRQANNSSSMKSLSGTIAAAAIALYGSLDNAQWAYLLGAGLPVVMFWVLDARYLQIECAYRHLYDSIRKGEHQDIFGMDYTPYLKKSRSLLGFIFSWSVGLFYSVILVSFAVIYWATEYTQTAAGTAAP